MALQAGDLLRNNMIGQYETTVGPSPKLQLRTGLQAANCAAAAAGVLLAEITLPADWLTAPSSGGVALSGSWSGTGLPAAGGGTTIGHFRLLNNAGTVCHEHGSVTLTGNGGDLTVDNLSIANAQPVNITGWSRLQSGA